MFYYSWPSFKEVKDYGKRTVSGGWVYSMCVFSLVLRHYLFTLFIILMIPTDVYLYSKSNSQTNLNHNITTTKQPVGVLCTVVFLISD